MLPNPQETADTWSHLLKKSFMENFIFCAVRANGKILRLPH